MTPTSTGGPVELNILNFIPTFNGKVFVYLMFDLKINLNELNIYLVKRLAIISYLML